MTKNTMNEYLLLFRGGANPEDMTPEQMQTTMHNWMTWMKELKKNKQMGTSGNVRIVRLQRDHKHPRRNAVIAESALEPDGDCRILTD